MLLFERMGLVKIKRKLTALNFSCKSPSRRKTLFSCWLHGWSHAVWGLPWQMTGKAYGELVVSLVDARHVRAYWVWSDLFLCVHKLHQRQVWDSVATFGDRIDEKFRRLSPSLCFLIPIVIGFHPEDGSVVPRWIFLPCPNFPRKPSVKHGRFELLLTH